MKPLANGNYSTEPSLNPPEPPDTVECPTCLGEKVVEVRYRSGHVEYEECECEHRNRYEYKNELHCKDCPAVYDETVDEES